MQVYMWGTRGSLPASITAERVRTRIETAIAVVRRRPPAEEDSIAGYLEQTLPFAVRGTYGGNTSCMELRGGTDFVVCDAGSGLRDFGAYVVGLLRAGQAKAPLTFHLFVSHLHWDHIHGFPFFVPAYIPGTRLHIYGCHPGIEAAFTRQQEPPFFPVPLGAMQASIDFRSLEVGREYDLAGFTVQAIKQHHPGDSYGYAFAAGGRRVVYSTDSEHKEGADQPDSPFVAFIRHADLLVFDAQYSLLDAIGAKENWGHSSNLVAVELAVRAGVRRLCLFHSEHTCDDDSLDRFLDDTRRYHRLHAPDCPLTIDLAYDGLTIDV